MNVQKRFFSSILMLCFSIVIFSCNYLEDRPREETFIAILDFDVIDLDPIGTNDIDTSNILCEIYEGLFKYDENLRAVPSLAEKWEVEDDVHYTFHLKKGVSFHNGQEMKAEDVAFSLQRAISSETLFYLFDSIDLDSFKIIDDYTISFSLVRADPTLFLSLCHTAAYIVCKNASTTLSNGQSSLALEPVGTGPFKVLSIQESNVVLERFDSYHGKIPYFKFMQFRTNERLKKRVAELENGNADIICNLNMLEIETCKQNPALKVLSTQGFAVEYLGFNMKQKPLDDIRVRMAIAKGLDVDLINKVTSNGLYVNATAPYPPVIPYSLANKRQVASRDVEGARTLLFEAGYQDGLSLRFLVQENFEITGMASKIKEQLWRIGIDCEMEVLEWNEFLTKMDEGEAQLFLYGWIPDLPDPDSALRDYFHSSVTFSEGNYVGCEDEELDELLEEGHSTLDEKLREKIYTRAQERIMEITPAVFIHYEQLNIVMQQKYEGVNVSPLGYHFLAYARPSIVEQE